MKRDLVPELFMRDTSIVKGDSFWNVEIFPPVVDHLIKLQCQKQFSKSIQLYKRVSPNWAKKFNQKTDASSKNYLVFLTHASQSIESLNWISTASIGNANTAAVQLKDQPYNQWVCLE